MNKIMKSVVALACAAALVCGGRAFPAKAAENGVVQSGSFLAPDGWSVSGGYERDFGENFFGDSVFFSADAVKTTDGDKKNSSALYYTQAIEEGVTIDIGLRLLQGETEILLGAGAADSVSPQGAQKITIGASSFSFGEDKGGYGFDITNKRADISVDTAADSLTVTCGESVFTKKLELGSAAGYFGLAFMKESAAKGNVLDVCFIKEGKVVAGDTFTDESTIAPFNSDAAGYMWKRIAAEDVGAGARVLRAVSGNEIYNYGASWPSEFAYTGFEFVGGIGANYTVQYDITLMRSGWIGMIFNSNKMEAGERRINDNTALSGGRTFAAFADGKLKTMVFGSDDGSKLEGEELSYSYGRKMHVTMEMTQIGESETALDMSFIYADDPAQTKHATQFNIKQALKGQVAFSHSAEFVFSDLRIFDGEGKYVGGDDFSSENTYEKVMENWYVGLTAADPLKNYVVVEDFGTYENGTLSFSEISGAGVSEIDSSFAVPAREAGVDTRENMFGAVVEVRAGALSDGSYSFRFGDGNSVKIEKDKISALGKNGVIAQADFVGEGEYALGFTAKSSGEMTVTKDGEKVLTAAFGGEETFVGAYGFSVTRAADKMDLALKTFELSVEGIPQHPVLSVEKPPYLAVGREIDLTPAVMRDETDDVSALELDITVKNTQSGKTVEVKDNKVILPETGYYTVHYKLTNTHGLSAEDEFTARGVYRGEAVDLADKVVTDFTGASAGWKIDKGAVSNGNLQLSAGGSLSTEANFIYFLADFEVKGSFELVFGQCRDYENAFGIAVNADNTVTLRNLYAQDGTRNAVLAKDIALGEGVASVRLKVIGSTVTLYGRAESDPLKYYELASFKFESDMPVTYGTISLVAKEGAALSRAAVYSLDSGIEIPPDDYDPSDEMTGKHPKPVRGNKTGLIVGLSVGGAALIAGGACLAAVLIKKKNKANKANDNANDTEEGGKE